MKITPRSFFGLQKKGRIDTPRNNFGVVFDVVQLSRALIDSKTFVDCIPKHPPDVIIRNYQKLHGENLSIREFVRENFFLPDPYPAPHAEVGIEAPTKEIRAYIEHMWKELTRKPKTVEKNSSLIPLPHRYVVPGGRFRELYYWDSYFTMIGLKESGHIDLIREMVANFAYLIDTYGFIPNGTRTYYLTRSHPPMFALMVELLYQSGETLALQTYLPHMEKEYQYWMRGITNASFASKKINIAEHVVRMHDGEILNRYFDSGIRPREESFAEDVETARRADDSSSFYRNIRAGAESGWDFSSRWFKDGKNLETIRTADIVPPDLNALLFETERIIADAYEMSENNIKGSIYREHAQKRAFAMQKYLWDETHGWYADYIHTEDALSEHLSLAGVFPLLVGVATQHQAEQTAKGIEKIFLRPGGLVSTNITTGEQWDAPNGWAPLQYATVVGLERYGYSKLAEEVAQRFTKTVLENFENTGTLLEKYNVENVHALATGGEYALQDGFGWTNGVVLYFMNRYQLNTDHKKESMRNAQLPA